MVEIIAIFSLVITLIGILTYLYFHEKDQHNYIKNMQNNVTNLPVNLQKFYAEISLKESQQTQKVLGESFNKFLKHIEKLENKVLPKPVTTKDVRSVMNRMGEVADETLENEIELEKDKGVEMPNDEWTGVIDKNTKVVFEGDAIPTVIE